MKASSFKYQDGTPKNHSRIVFENVFDKTLEARGIANPKQYRRD